MFVAELSFLVIGDTSYNKAESAIRHYLESLIFRGQMLGREMPTYFQQDRFISRVQLPAPDALKREYHSEAGLLALQRLAGAGLALPKLSMLGEDLMANHTDPCNSPPALILYTRFALQNSPVYCFEHFAPVPLYKLAPQVDFESLIRWQLQYQALDEIQMQQDSVLLKSAERALQQPRSQLNQTGRTLARQLSKLCNKPVYYALYRGSSDNCATEHLRRCPDCGAQWQLAANWHQLFDFRCDSCMLLSNIAWQCQ